MAQHYERVPTEIFKHTNSNQETIIFGNGPAVTRELLQADINGDSIEGIYLYRLEGKEGPAANSDPTLKMGGVGTIGHFYTEEAILSAQAGHDFVTFVPNLKQNLIVQMMDPRHRKDVYLRHAQNGLKVARAVLNRTDKQQVQVSAHSYGGVTTPPLLEKFPDYISRVVMQDPSGLHGHNLQPKKLWNNELKKVAGYFAARKEILPPGTMKYAVQRFTDNPVLAGREIFGLYQPDTSEVLNRANERGVPLALLLLGESAIFNATEARKSAEAMGVFSAITELPDAGHIDPVTDAPDIVPAQIALFSELVHKKAA